MSRRECNFGGCNDSVIHLTDDRSMGWFCIFTSIENDNNQLNVGKMVNVPMPWIRHGLLWRLTIYMGFVFYWWCFSLFKYHGKSPLNHHLGRIFLELCSRHQTSKCKLTSGGVKQKKNSCKARLFYFFDILYLGIVWVASHHDETEETNIIFLYWYRPTWNKMTNMEPKSKNARAKNWLPCLEFAKE